MAGVNPGWSVTGHAQTMVPPGIAAGGGVSTLVDPGGDGSTNSDWLLSAPAAAMTASLAYPRAGGMWPHAFGMAVAGSEGRTAPTAQLKFGEKAIHSTEMGRADTGSDGAAEQAADHFHWWVDSVSADSPRDPVNG